MTTARGNSSRAKKAEARTEENAKRWERARKTGPYADVEPVYDVEPGFSRHTQGEEVVVALEYLDRVIHDPAFEEAALAISAYGLKKGGLKQTTKQLLKRTGRTVLHELALKMKGASRVEAEEIIARYGPKGQSFDTLVRELVRARRAFEKQVAEPPQPFPDGDTGRRLLVRFAVLWLGAANEPLSSLFGCQFDPDGFAVVPDSRDWRREIRAGRICSFGVLAPDDALGAERRRAWKILQDSSHGK